jgi:hypothetical protein
MKNAFEIQIAPHPKKHDWYVAKYQSGFLSATYSVEFANSITGAVALYHFVEMLKTRYPGGQVTFMLPADAGRHAVAAVRDAFTMQRTT